MGFFDQAYDEMSWKEICYRLPSELAVNALKRRINNLETLKMFLDNARAQSKGIKPLKDCVNEIVSAATLDDLFAMFDEKYQPMLFNWLSQDNVNRFKSYDPSKLSLKFLFNITDSKDQVGLSSILDKVLAEPELSQSHLRAVLRKADNNCMAVLINRLLADARPEVRVCVLSIPGGNATTYVGDLQKIIGLKALAKCTADKPIDAVNIMSINLFANLRPLERITALERYLACFPLYHKMHAFDPVPSEEEFQMILFAGCVEYNDRIVKINELYNQITKADAPKEDEGEE